MPSLNAYLTFNGNCREAMKFYKTCFGGELMLQTIGSSPLAGAMPKEMKDCIVHASLSTGDIVLMGSDLVPDEGLSRGNSVSLSLGCKSEQELTHLYAVLSAGGRSTHPPQPTFWGALFGDLTDKYGNNWLLYWDEKIISVKDVLCQEGVR